MLANSILLTFSLSLNFLRLYRERAFIYPDLSRALYSGSSYSGPLRACPPCLIFWRKHFFTPTCPDAFNRDDSCRGHLAKHSFNIAYPACERRFVYPEVIVRGRLLYAAANKWRPYLQTDRKPLDDINAILKQEQMLFELVTVPGCGVSLAMQRRSTEVSQDIDPPRSDNDSFLSCSRIRRRD